MDRWFTIDHQYDAIHLKFDLPKLKVPLEDEWEALAEAEHRLYYNTGAPTYGWTGVIEREDSWFIKEMWDQCESYIESTEENWATMPRRSQLVLIAKRVARVNAVMVYGPEYLLV